MYLELLRQAGQRGRHLRISLPLHDTSTAPQAGKTLNSRNADRETAPGRNPTSREGRPGLSALAAGFDGPGGTAIMSWSPSGPVVPLSQESNDAVPKTVTSTNEVHRMRAPTRNLFRAITSWGGSTRPCGVLGAASHTAESHQIPC